jgi:acetyl/propionyl-CoA carboxylase alpha subunit
VSAPRPIERLAIVNRGEAAMRCIRAVKALRAAERSRMLALALYTDVDRDAPFVRHADVALRLPAEAGEVAAYLDHDRLLAVLQAAGADAVWPGWGFVSEDARFVERLEEVGIRFLGPSPEAMRQLGDKISSKIIAERSGVPVTPWSGGAVADEGAAEEHAARLGYPVVLKASAGGGGRGAPRRWPKPSARRPPRPRPPSATPGSSWSARSPGGGTSRCRSRPTSRASSCPWAAATARCSGATRRSSKRLRRPG